MAKGTIVLTYPPTFDGQLDIEVESKPTLANRQDYTFKFTVASKKDESAWDALVRIAHDVLEQESRRK